MSNQTDILPLDGESNAQAAARLNADPSRFQAVPSKNLGAWAALGGRLYKLESFVAAPNGGNPTLIGMQSAVKMTLQLLANPTTEIYVNPGHPHRQLLDGLVAAQVLTAGDVSDLVEWYGRKLPAVTEADVAAAVAAHALRTAKDAALATREAANSAFRNACDAAQSIEEIPTP